MSDKCVVISDDGKYLTPRRNNGVQYESRSGWSGDIEDAKIFQTKAAAKNSAEYNGKKPYTIKRVNITVIYLNEPELNDPTMAKRLEG